MTTTEITFPTTKLTITVGDTLFASVNISCWCFLNSYSVCKQQNSVCLLWAVISNSGLCLDVRQCVRDEQKGIITTLCTVNITPGERDGRGVRPCVVSPNNEFYNPHQNKMFLKISTYPTQSQKCLNHWVINGSNFSKGTFIYWQINWMMKSKPWINFINSR